MKICNEIFLKDFEFWGGAIHTASWLTKNDFYEIEEFLIEWFDDKPVSETTINDIFWFDTDEIAEILGYENFEELMEKRSKK